MIQSQQLNKMFFFIYLLLWNDTTTGNILMCFYNGCYSKPYIELLLQKLQ